MPQLEKSEEVIALLTDWEESTGLSARGNL
jgi:hypothetical protein